jgi:hypothetical protein
MVVLNYIVHLQAILHNAVGLGLSVGYYIDILCSIIAGTSVGSIYGSFTFQSTYVNVMKM